MSLSDTALLTLIQAKNFLHKDAASSLQIFAEYVGVGTGSATAFSLDNTPETGSLKLYVANAGGVPVLQTETTDYSISGANITFITIPASGRAITAAYDYAASANTFEAYDDDLLEILINSATKKCEDFCGRAFIQRTTTENRIGDGGNLLKLNKRPVSTLTSITLAGGTLTEDTDFTLYKEEGYLTRPIAISPWTTDILSISWTEGTKIVVTYTAGYASTRAATQALVPDAVLAVLVAVANWYENRLGLASESVSGIGSQSYVIGELPEQSRKLLSSLNSGLGIY